MAREKIIKAEFYTKDDVYHIDLTDSDRQVHCLETQNIWKHRALFCLQNGFSNEYYPNFVSYRAGLGFSVNKVEINGKDTKQENELVVVNSYNQKPISGRYTRMLESECECKVLVGKKEIKLDYQEDAIISALINGSELYISSEYVYDMFFYDGNEYISLFELDTSGPSFLGKASGLYEKFIKNYEYGAKRSMWKDDILTAEFLLNQFCHQARKGIDVKIKEVTIDGKYGNVLTDENGSIKSYQTYFEDALIIKDIAGCDGFIEINRSVN